MDRTLAPTSLFGVREGDGSTFVVGIGALCSAFDLAYLALLRAARRRAPSTRPPVAAPTARSP